MSLYVSLNLFSIQQFYAYYIYCNFEYALKKTDKLQYRGSIIKLFLSL